jgi:toxin ParE1/3/4
MTPGFTILPAADRDLDDHATYLWREAGIETALRFYDGAAATFESLARTPGIGAPWDSPNPGLAGMRVLRVRGFKHHLVFYRPGERGIEIVRVVHAARDIESVLAED